jgi:hypothetical protein
MTAWGKNRTRYLVCGGRDFKSYEAVKRALDALILHPEHAVVIHGDYRGADKLADKWAIERGVPVERYPAKWDQQGHAAGPIRNAQMIAEGQPDVVIAFPGHDGTDNMIAQARAAEIVVVQVVR